MEQRGVLDIDDPFDMCALHLYFLPVIQSTLRHIADINDEHKIRTAGNKSPNWLWEDSRSVDERLG